MWSTFLLIAVFMMWSSGELNSVQTLPPFKNNRFFGLVAERPVFYVFARFWEYLFDYANVNRRYGMKRLTVAGLMLGLMLMMAVCAFGAVVPQVINYSGTLTNISGSPVPDGTYNIEFYVYGVPTGGTPLWTEKWSSTATPSSPVLVTGGAFNVMLGAITAFPIDFFAKNPNTYLGIKVGADSEMLPRQKIASVGYAFTAGNGVPKGGVIMWSGAVNQIPDGWVLCNGANGTPDLRDRFVVGAGNNYASNLTGGNSAINLGHAHNVGISEAGNHAHGGTTTGPNDFSDRNKTDSHSLYNTPSNSHIHTINSDGSHAHSAWTDSQLSSAQDIRPPFFALAFIMKL